MLLPIHSISDRSWCLDACAPSCSLVVIAGRSSRDWKRTFLVATTTDDALGLEELLLLDSSIIVGLVATIIAARRRAFCTPIVATAFTASSTTRGGGGVGTTRNDSPRGSGWRLLLLGRTVMVVSGLLRRIQIRCTQAVLLLERRFVVLLVLLFVLAFCFHTVVELARFLFCDKWEGAQTSNVMHF